MKLLLTLICFVTFGVMSAHAQQSTKYKLFPDFDKDYQRLKSKDAAPAAARSAKPVNAGTPTKQRLFDNYTPQNTAAAKSASRKGQAGQSLPSATSSETAAKEQAAKAANAPKAVQPELQGGTQPVEASPAAPAKAAPVKTTPAAPATTTPKLNAQPAKKTTSL